MATTLLTAWLLVDRKTASLFSRTEVSVCLTGRQEYRLSRSGTASKKFILIYLTIWSKVKM